MMNSKGTGLEKRCGLFEQVPMQQWLGKHTKLAICSIRLILRTYIRILKGFIHPQHRKIAVKALKLYWFTKGQWLKNQNFTSLLC
jgi:hypothetical protein